MPRRACHTGAGRRAWRAPRGSCAILLCALPLPAAAYIEPGLGSMLLQALVGGAAGLLVALRLYWHELKRIWQRLLVGLRPGARASGRTDDSTAVNTDPPASR